MSSEVREWCWNLGTVVTCGCEPPNVGTGSGTLVCSKPSFQPAGLRGSAEAVAAELRRKAFADCSFLFMAHFRIRVGCVEFFCV